MAGDCQLEWRKGQVRSLERRGAVMDTCSLVYLENLG